MILQPIRSSARSLQKTWMTNRVIFILYILVLVSLCVGPSLSACSAVSLLCDRLLDASLAARNSNQIVLVFFLSFGLSLASFLPLCFCGLSACGIATAPLWLIGYALGISAFAGRCYERFHTVGLLLFLALFLIPLVVTLVADLLAAREAFTFSRILCGGFSARKETVSFHSDFRLYCLRQLTVLSLVPLSSAFSVVLTLLFFRLFSLP